jgi:16S rRNA (uracil1498-N3)-methyltransferase
MDLIVQKATELGVARVRPVMTEFGVIRLNEERAMRRREHWQRIARAACEQSGRHVIPSVDVPVDLADALADDPGPGLRIVLDPGAQRSFSSDLGAAQCTRCCLLIGPEGGFSQRDLASAQRAGFESAKLGPRILRVETAAIAACTLAQSWWGDLR